MKTVQKIVMLVINLFLIFMVVWGLDVLFFGSRYSHKLAYGEDCGYVVPDGYKIVYNESDKLYAVKVLLLEDYYLYDGRFGITTMFSSIAKPSLFVDSCEAKAYLRAYIVDQKPKLQNYK